MTTNFFYRTEDIRTSEILKYFAETEADRNIINSLKATNPVLIEGSRGTGKSFLMRIAEAEINENFDTEKVVAVYVPFLKSSLIHTDDPYQFRHWMLAKTCTKILRVLRKRGLTSPPSYALKLLAGGPEVDSPDLERIEAAYEASWKSPGSAAPKGKVPDVDELKDALEDICTAYGLSRFCIFFDEAAHILRPQQQRQFFTLFRDLRAPHITCNAAVYPGVTSYGDSFELTHDATRMRVLRDIHAPTYAASMREIVNKQADEGLRKAITQGGERFDSIAYAVHGNPRFLLKIIGRNRGLKSRELDTTLKKFFGTEIWAEHTGLGERFKGHRALVDWGRDFIESNVIPDTRRKNKTRARAGRPESTCYFWVHRDAPTPVKESLRLLEYTGIVHRGDSGIRGTRSEVGTRYALTLGCLAAVDASPLKIILPVARTLSVKRFTEYGHNHIAYATMSLADMAVANDIEDVLQEQLSRPVAQLDLTRWQKKKLTDAGYNSVGSLLSATEADLIAKIHYVGEKRSRQIMNAATTAVLEFLSG